MSFPVYNNPVTDPESGTDLLQQGLKDYLDRLVAALDALESTLEALEARVEALESAP